VKGHIPTLLATPRTCFLGRANLNKGFHRKYEVFCDNIRHFAPTHIVFTRISTEDPRGHKNLYADGRNGDTIKALGFGRSTNQIKGASKGRLMFSRPFKKPWAGENKPDTALSSLHTICFSVLFPST